MDPGQVVANVQSALQEQGYYQGDIDGILGPQTRAALADYQQDNGLTVTSAVDEPTLDSLGIS
jgi:His-Xaa-Ser repeat protein HxsA